MKIWINVHNGQTTCPEHAGNELSFSIESAPTALQHETSFGTWVAATPEEVQDLVLIAGDACETCAFGF